MNETKEEKQVKEKLQILARYIQAQLPSKEWGFVLLCFALGENARSLYASNCKRFDVVRAMYEWINATRDSYGSDEPTLDTELGRLRQRVAQLEEMLTQAGLLEPGQGKTT
jgi:hypothetical protein